MWNIRTLVGKECIKAKIQGKIFALFWSVESPFHRVLGEGGVFGDHHHLIWISFNPISNHYEDEILKEVDHNLAIKSITWHSSKIMLVTQLNATHTSQATQSNSWNSNLSEFTHVPKDTPVIIIIIIIIIVNIQTNLPLTRFLACFSRLSSSSTGWSSARFSCILSLIWWSRCTLWWSWKFTIICFLKLLKRLVQSKILGHPYHWYDDHSTHKLFAECDVKIVKIWWSWGFSSSSNGCSKANILYWSWWFLSCICWSSRDDFIEWSLRERQRLRLILIHMPFVTRRYRS